MKLQPVSNSVRKQNLFPTLCHPRDLGIVRCNVEAETALHELCTPSLPASFLPLLTVGCLKCVLQPCLCLPCASCMCVCSDVLLKKDL